MKNDAPREILTDTAFAERVGVTAATVRRWRRQYGMPYMKAGNQVLIDWNTFLTWAGRNGSHTRTRERR